jgi:hypothetical protein
MGRLRFVNSHPSRKNKDAARVGHPLQSDTRLQAEIGPEGVDARFGGAVHFD